MTVFIANKIYLKIILNFFLFLNWTFIYLSPERILLFQEKIFSYPEEISFKGFLRHHNTTFSSKNIYSGDEFNQFWRWEVKYFLRDYFFNISWSLTSSDSFNELSAAIHLSLKRGWEICFRPSNVPERPTFLAVSFLVLKRPQMTEKTH